MIVIIKFWYFSQKSGCVKRSIISTYRPHVPLGRVGWFRPITNEHFSKSPPSEPADWPLTSYAARWHTRSISRHGSRFHPDVETFMALT